MEAGLQEAGNDMANVETKLTPTDRQVLAERIEQLEANTDAEVVCAVATESGRYDRAESVCGLFVGLVALVLANKIVTFDDWDVTTALPVGWQVVFMVGGFVVGTLLASYWHGLRRVLVAKNEMQSEVRKCVHQVFSEYGVGGTRHRGGLLIYVSLFERRLEIHFDSLLDGKLAPGDLDSIRDAVLLHLRAGNLTDGLMAGLNEADRVLSLALPHSEDSVDALQNQVLVFHPRPY